MRTLPLLLATGSLALFAGGCGGDDNDNGGDSAARGYAETGQALDDICKRANAENKQLGAGINGEPKNDAPIIEKVVAANQKYVDEAKAVKPDPKLQDTFDRWVEKLDATQAKSREALDAAKAGNAKDYQAKLQELSKLDKETDPLAKALGAKACASN